MRKFFEDFIIYGFASILGKLITVFLIPLYTNVLSKEEYGAMALIVACKGIIDLFSNLNIHSGIARDYYEEKVNRTKLISTGFISILVISCSVFVLVFLLTDLITTNILGIPGHKDSFILMALSIPAGSLMSYFSILTRYKKKPVQYTIGVLVQLFIQITISILGILWLKLGVVSIFAGILVSEIVATIFFGYINKSNIAAEFDVDSLKRALIFAIPTLPAILAGWVDSSLGQIIIGKYISVEDLAVYSLALQMASVFTLVSTAFQNVWSPYLFENYKKKGFLDDASTLFGVMSLFLLLISLTISIFSKEIVTILSNDGYLKASLYFPLLCIPMSFYMLFPFATSGILISRDTKYVGISYVIGSILNIVTIFLLIGIMGIFAIPVALSVSRIFTFEYMRRKSAQVFMINCPVFILLMIVAVSIGSFIINMSDMSFLIRLLVCIICTLLMISYSVRRYGTISFLSILQRGK